MSETAVTVGLRARWLQLSGNSRGALWMIASGLGFSVMAVGIKLLGYRLDSFQIGFFRVVIGLLAILPFVAGSDIAQLRTRHAGVHFVRAAFGLLAMYCSYYAIARMPLAATFGFVGFAELPTIWTFAGAAVIVASTLYIAHREAQLRT